MIETNKWYAAQVRSNYESICQTSLLAKGYEVLLPTYTKRRVRNRVPTNVEVALFKGYLFVRSSEKEAAKAVMTPGFIRFVRFGDGPVAIDDNEIANIELISRSPVIRQPWKYIPAGSRVRIETGPLTGLVGILVANEHTRHAVVSISLLKRSAAVTLDDSTAIKILDSPVENSTSYPAWLSVSLSS